MTPPNEMNETNESPVIKIDNENDCVYGINGIATIHLGCGGTVITTIEHDEYSGVAFCHAIDNLGVGASHAELLGISPDTPKTVSECNGYFQIITENPDSLQVVIDKLTIARDILKRRNNPIKVGAIVVGSDA